MLLAGAVALLSALDRLDRPRRRRLDGGRYLRRRPRARARRRTDPALRLARDLRLPGTRGTDRPRRSVRVAPPSAWRGRAVAAASTANLALGLLFGALVGALFLGVLLVITVWGLSPIAGALVVSALPAGTARRTRGSNASSPPG